MRNAEEIAYWNAVAGTRWATYQDRIDGAFAPLSDAAFAAAAPSAGEVVLDIGCGCAATSFALANAVGPAGSVLGVDVSQSMLAVAEQRAADANVRNVRFVLADAATEQLGNGLYDLAFSRFGVMFFDDPIGAFTSVRRSLQPNGRLAFVCWRDLAANPWFAVPLDAVRPHVPPQPRLDPLAPGPLAFADPERVRDILHRAGFEDVRIDAFDARLELGARASACELLGQIGPAARLLDGADEAGRARAIDALDVALAANERDGVVGLDGGVWIVTARSGR